MRKKKIYFQESLYHSERYPLPLQIKSLSPSPLTRHRVHPPASSKSDSASFTNIAILPPTPRTQIQPIPLITKTGPNGPKEGQLITIIRQRSHPERGRDKTCAQNEIICTKCTRCTRYEVDFRSK